MSESTLGCTTMNVPTSRQVADIFTKPLGFDKLHQFSGMLDLQHLDVPILRGRVESAEEAESDDRTTGQKSSKGRTTYCRGRAMNQPNEGEPKKRRKSRRLRLRKPKVKLKTNWRQPI